MSKFEVGDKVRVVTISAPDHLPEIVNREGTVIAVRDRGVFPVTVSIDGERYNLSYYEIEHVRENYEERRNDANTGIQFKVGDKVRVVKAPKYIPELGGEVGTVIIARDHGIYPITVEIGNDRYDLSYYEIEHVHDDYIGYNRGDRVLVKNFGDYMQCEILSDGFYYAGAKRYVVRSISEDVMRIVNENQIIETLTNNDN